MSTVFGALDAHDEGDRRVPPAGWASWDAFHLYLADADGGRAPYRMDPERVQYEREDQRNDATRDWLAEHETNREND